MLEKLNLTLESVYIATNRVTERKWEKKIHKPEQDNDFLEAPENVCLCFNSVS